MKDKGEYGLLILTVKLNLTPAKINTKGTLKTGKTQDIFYSLAKSASSAYFCSLCRCDSHRWADSTRRSWRGAEESSEVMLQEQPANSYCKQCTFSGEGVGMRCRHHGKMGNRE